MSRLGDKRFDSTPPKKDVAVRDHERRTKRGSTHVKRHFRSKRKGEKFTREESADVQKIMKADNFDPDEFHTGMNEELEHWDLTQGDPFETAEIVIAHLKEKGDYYDRLEEAMED